MQMTPQTHSEHKGCLSGLLPRFRFCFRRHADQWCVPDGIPLYKTPKGSSLNPKSQCDYPVCDMGKVAQCD